MSGDTDAKSRPDEPADDGLARDTFAALEAAGDADGLVALARAHRAGDGVPRDLKECFRAYEAAARLGHADARYALALFYLSGGVVPQDLKEAAAQLRAAADGGVLSAKVYLANMYEFGIHFRADPEKADVWHRAAARAANIEPAADSPDYAIALAELGCARFAMAAQSDPAIADDVRARVLRKANALGYALKKKEERQSDPGKLLEPSLDEAHRTEADPASPPTNAVLTAAGVTKATDAKARLAQLERQAKAPRTPRYLTIERGLRSFGVLLIFAVAAAGAAYALHAGAATLLAQGHPIPVFKQRLDLVAPSSFAVLAGVPALLVYRIAAFLKAIVIGVVGAGLAWAAWGTGAGLLFDSRLAQTEAGAAVLFFVGLLVLGLFGGAKKTSGGTI